MLVERLKSHRSSFPVEQRLDSRQRRPSTIAEQTVAKVTPRSKEREEDREPPLDPGKVQ